MASSVMFTGTPYHCLLHERIFADRAPRGLLLDLVVLEPRILAQTDERARRPRPNAVSQANRRCYVPRHSAASDSQLGLVIDQDE